MPAPYSGAEHVRLPQRIDIRLLRIRRRHHHIRLRRRHQHQPTECGQRTVDSPRLCKLQIAHAHHRLVGCRHELRNQASHFQRDIARPCHRRDDGRGRSCAQLPLAAKPQPRFRRPASLRLPVGPVKPRIGLRGIGASHRPSDDDDATARGKCDDEPEPRAPARPSAVSRRPGGIRAVLIWRNRGAAHARDCARDPADGCRCCHARALLPEHHHARPVRLHAAYGRYPDDDHRRRETRQEPRYAAPSRMHESVHARGERRRATPRGS
mmetsp:Transcript_8217/g.21178  ORF Transcript_8217/g.21178 Transcript_8217/m.21178 type:complete len:267 (-) Transcript_8217:699-1499(-)